MEKAVHYDSRSRLGALLRLRHVGGEIHLFLRPTVGAAQLFKDILLEPPAVAWEKLSPTKRLW